MRAQLLIELFIDVVEFSVGDASVEVGPGSGNGKRDCDEDS